MYISAETTQPSHPVESDHKNTPAGPSTLHSIVYPCLVINELISVTAPAALAADTAGVVYGAKENQAAVKIQRYYRGYRAKRVSAPVSGHENGAMTHAEPPNRNPDTDTEPTPE